MQIEIHNLLGEIYNIHHINKQSKVNIHSIKCYFPEVVISHQVAGN